ncbi:MAG TPA: MFS transporter [Deltaproteobacteria bacterium]|nr:MFS transporter [Deltaproteobacteria bacterium]
MTKSSREFGLILGAHTLFFLNFSELILLPVYFTDTGYSPGRIGAFMAAFSVAVVASLPVCGLLSDRLPRRRMFALGALLMAVPSALYGALPRPDLAIPILRALQGIGFSSAFGIMGAMVADLDSHEDTRTRLGVLTAAGMATHAAGPALGEFLVARWGYQALFFSSASFGLASLAVSFFLPGKTPPRAEAFPAGRSLIRPAWASAVLGAVFGGTTVFVPPLVDARVQGGAALFFVSLVAGSLAVWAALSRHRNTSGWAPPRAAWIAASVLTTLLPILLSRTGRPAGYLILGTLFGAGYGYLYPSLNSVMIETSRNRAGSANAFFVWSFNIGMLVSTLGLGMAIESQGIEAPMRILGLSCLVLLLWARVKRTPR